MAGISTLGSKAVNMLVMVLSVPMTLNYLGKERFGLLMAVMSMVAFMAFSDLGLGLGVLNRVSKYDNEKNPEAIRMAVSSTFFFLLGFSLLSVVVFTGLFPFMEWHRWFGSQDVAVQQEVQATVAVFAACFFLMLPFTIIQKIQSGFQEGFLNELWDAAGNIFSLIFLLVAVYFQAGVPVILLALYGSKVLSMVLNFVYHVGWKRPWLSPKWSAFNWDWSKEIVKEGLLFFVLQLSILFMTSIDNMLISRYMGVSEVAVYALAYRLYAMFMMPTQAFIGHSMPAFNEAFVSHDYTWIRSFWHKISRLILLVSFSCMVLYLLMGNWLVRHWVGEGVVFTTFTLVSFGAYIVYSNINSFFLSIFMTGRYIRICVYLSVITALITMALKVGLIGYWGFEGLLWITILVSLLVLFIPGYFIFKKDYLRPAQ